MVLAVSGYEVGVAVHVLAAVCAVGPLLLEPLLAKRALGAGSKASGQLFESMLWGNRVFVTPAFIVLFLVGFYLTGESGQSLGEPWASYGVAAVIIVLGILHGWIAPRLREAARLLGGSSAAVDLQRVTRGLYAGWTAAALISVVAVVWMSLQAS